MPNKQDTISSSPSVSQNLPSTQESQQQSQSKQESQSIKKEPHQRLLTDMFLKQPKKPNQTQMDTTETQRKMNMSFPVREADITKRQRTHLLNEL